MGLPPLAAAIVAAGLGLSALHHLRLAGHRSALAIAALDVSADGRLGVADPGGSGRPAELRRAAVPAGWIAVRLARDARGRSRSLVILPDAADAEVFRRLPVWLKWGVSPSHSRQGGTNDPIQG